MTTAILMRLATRLRSIEDELATSLQRSPSQLLDSVATATRDLDALRLEVHGATSPAVTRLAGRLLGELEEAVHCGRSILGEQSMAAERLTMRMIGHVHAARAALAVAS